MQFKVYLESRHAEIQISTKLSYRRHLEGRIDIGREEHVDIESFCKSKSGYIAWLSRSHYILDVMFAHRFLMEYSVISVVGGRLLVATREIACVFYTFVLSYQNSAVVSSDKTASGDSTLVEAGMTVDILEQMRPMENPLSSVRLTLSSHERL
jgi:hypothetical protein